MPKTWFPLEGTYKNVPSRSKLIKQLTDEISTELLFEFCTGGGVLYLLADAGKLNPELSPRFMEIERFRKEQELSR